MHTRGLVALYKGLIYTRAKYSHLHSHTSTRITNTNASAPLRAAYKQANANSDEHKNLRFGNLTCMKQGITISPHEMGATRRCSSAAKPRLRPLRPPDRANVKLTCTKSRLNVDGSIAEDRWESPARCAGAYLRWTVGAARNGAANCELQEM